MQTKVNSLDRQAKKLVRIVAIAMVVTIVIIAILVTKFGVAHLM